MNVAYDLAAQDNERSAPAPLLEPGETDFCSRDGALALKAKIEAYWRARGLDVQISMMNVGFHPAIRAARFDLRSDMINGLPRGARKKV